MPLSPRFRALLRLTGLWALPWTAGGIVLGTIRWVLSPDLRSGTTTLGTWLFNHALGYGCLGAISGLYLGLLITHLAHATPWRPMTKSRLALWAGTAGAAPAVLFAGLGLIFGASSAVVLPLAALAAVSAVGGAVLATATHAATARPALPEAKARPLNR